MSHISPILSQLSEALSALASGARGFVADVQTQDEHRLSGVLWKPNAVVVSEQKLPEAAEYEVKVAGRSAKAHLAGRDEGTNVAVLKLQDDFPQTLPGFALPQAGSLALVLGAAIEGVSIQLALIRSVGGPWESLAGSMIDHRIVVDAEIGSEEGGPVLAADGAILGISTRGARRQSLVIPASTVDNSVGILLASGRVARGWLGVSLRPVALPDALRLESRQRIGLMVMDVGADGPGAKAGILAGDIILSAGGMPATRFGNITRQLGPRSIGTRLEVNLARAGAVIASEVTIAPKEPDERSRS